MTAPTLPKYTGSTVDVSVIPAGQVTLSTAFIIKDPAPGHDVTTAPCYSFLIENKAKGKKLLFDLGLPKAWREKLPPKILAFIEAGNGSLDIKKDVADHFREAGVPLESIDGIIWSHHHMDHVGDPSVFPPSTALIVGPGFKTDKSTFPGYPKNPDAGTIDDAFQGRNVVELDFAFSSTEIGGFPAIDYFGDGSFFLLYTKGHTHDHLSGLARTSENKFIFFGGDVAHHAGEFRPTSQLPLPDEIHPSPLDDDSFNPRQAPLPACPGSIIEKVHPRKGTKPEHYRITPFYEPSPGLNASLPEAEAAIEKLQAFDASAEVFVVIAHDADLQSILPLFPSKVNNWDSAGYKPLGRWRFLKDFLKAGD
ncbi:metallo-beta-lactamase superfamily protein [Aspergillus aurantiobrunneus]